MVVEPARRLRSLSGQKLAFLDCGKRGGEVILRAVASRISDEGASISGRKKTSAHRMASRKLIEELSTEYDAIVYGVVD